MKYIKYYSEYSSRDYIVESLKTGKQLASKYSIDSSTFDSLIDIDPTTSKNYLDSIIKFYARDNAGLDVLKEYISIWIGLVQKNIIPPNKRDINKIKSFQEFSDLIHQYQTVKTSSEQKRDAHRMEREWAEQHSEVVYDENGWFIVRPLDHNASVWFGRNSHWCTAVRNDSTNWNRYKSELYTIYYCLDKTKPTYNYNGGKQIGDPSSLIVVAVPISQFKEKEIYDGGDNQLDYDEWIDTVPIPNRVFVFNESGYIEALLDNNISNNSINSSVFYKIDDFIAQLTDENKLYEIDIPNLNSILGTIIDKGITNIRGSLVINDNLLGGSSTLPENLTQINSITGSLTIDSFNILTLENLPKRIHGDLIFKDSYLENFGDNIENTIIDGSMMLAYNKIMSLKGCPTSIGKDLDLRGNEISNIDNDDIIHVGGNLFLANNLFGKSYFLEEEKIRSKINVGGIIV